MKATVLVRLKPEVLDPQGDAVRRALGTLGFEGVRDVRVGKIVEIELEDGAAWAAGTYFGPAAFGEGAAFGAGMAVRLDSGTDGGSFLLRVLPP